MNLLQLSNENSRRLYSFIEEAAAWMLKQQNPKALIKGINAVCWELEELNRQLTKPELLLLERIARTENYFKNCGMRLNIGVEQEISFIKAGKELAEGISAKIYDILGDEIAQVCQIAGTRGDESSGILFKFGVEPNLNSETNLERCLREHAGPGEFRTAILNPLQAIMVTRLAELAIYGQIYSGLYSNENYEYVRLNNHIHFSFTTSDSQTEAVHNFSENVVVSVIKTVKDGLPLLVSPEEREYKEVKSYTPNKLTIGSLQDKSYVIKKASEQNIAHYELRKTASGEPKIVIEDKIIGLDPLITSLAIICAGVEHGYSNFAVPLQKDENAAFSSFHSVKSTIFVPSEKNSARLSAMEAREEVHPYSGFIPDETFIKWFEDMQKSPVLNKYFGRELMSQLVAALVEQNPELASSVLQTRAR